MPAKPTRLGKQEVIDRWSALGPDHPMRVTPISYKHTGSSFDQDSIRITGSQEFIDSILARLIDLLEYDSNGTRLHVMYTQTLDRKTQELSGSWGCYVQVHERGQGRFGGGSGRPRGRKLPKSDDREEPRSTKATPLDPPDQSGPKCPKCGNTIAFPGTYWECGECGYTAEQDHYGVDLDDSPDEPTGPPVEPEQPAETTPADPPADPPIKSKRTTKGSTRYALATVHPDGDYDWAEPNGGVGCDTYDDEAEAKDNLAGFARTPGVNTTGLQVVKVRKNAKGKMELVK
jgi:hypothetical protein